MISWIDNSPEALRRQDALRKRERQDRGDEEREWAGIRQQIAKARKEGRSEDEDENEEARTLQRKEGEKIKLSFGTKKPTAAAEAAQKSDAEKNPPSPPLTDKEEVSREGEITAEPESKSSDANTTSSPATATTDHSPHQSPLSPTPKPQLKQPTPSATTKPTDVLAPAPKKNPLHMTKKSKPAPAPAKQMSEAERIMREEMERKQRRGATNGVGGNVSKRQRVS